MTGIVGYDLPVWWAIPISVLWLLGCTNAFNLIDGLDGLAAGVGLVATVTTLIAAILQHNFALALATVPLAGALLGFLRYNFNPASIFLGDSGSLFIGFLLGCYGLLWSQKSATVLGLTAPLIAVSIPLIDTLLAIARRFLRHQPIFGADRSHIHHKLLALGLRPKTVTLLIYGVCAVSACLSLLQSAFQERLAGAVIILVCIVTCICIQRLGYTEFGTAGRMLMPRAFRRVLRASLELDEFRQALRSAANSDECWHVILGAYQQFGFTEVIFKTGDQHYSHSRGVDGLTPVWTVRIPLTQTDCVTLARDSGGPIAPVAGSFADALAQIMTTKLLSNRELWQTAEVQTEKLGNKFAAV